MNFIFRSNNHHHIRHKTRPTLTTKAAKMGRKHKSEIKNKQVRTMMYLKLKKEKLKVIQKSIFSTFNHNTQQYLMVENRRKNRLNILIRRFDSIKINRFHHTSELEKKCSSSPSLTKLLEIFKYLLELELFETTQNLTWNRTRFFSSCDAWFLYSIIINQKHPTFKCQHVLIDSKMCAFICFCYLKEKKKSKLENKDKPKQAPKTIENCRVKDETFVNDIENDEELKLDLRTDELSKHLTKIVHKSDEDEQQGEHANSGEENDLSEKQFKQINDNNDEQLNESDVEVDDETDQDAEDDDDDEANSNDPKILITTTEIKVSFKTYKLCRELSRILPNAQYFYRKNVRLSKVIPEAVKRNYSAIIVINENQKEPSNYTIFVCFSQL